MQIPKSVIGGVGLLLCSAFIRNRNFDVIFFSVKLENDFCRLDVVILAITQSCFRCLEDLRFCGMSGPFVRVFEPLLCLAVLNQDFHGLNPNLNRNGQLRMEI